MSCIYRTHLPLPNNDARRRHRPPATSPRKAARFLLPFCDANHGTITRTVISRMTGPANCEMIGAMNDVAAPSAPPMTGDPFARAAASAATLKRLAGTDGFDAVVVLGSGWLAAADAI